MKVEQALLSHPAIVQASAFGVAHPHWGESLVACVQLAPDTSPSEEEIITHCKQTLSGFETPKRVLVTETFSMTNTGKVRKVELRQEYSELFT